MILYAKRNKKGKNMRDYLTIAEKIEDLSLKTSDEVIGMPLIITGGILLIIFVYFGISAINEIGFWDKTKRIAFSSIFLILGSLLGGFGTIKIYSHQDYNNSKVKEFLRKEGLEDLNVEKFLSNVVKVKKYDGVIPVKFKSCTRYGCTYDTRSYQNVILNDFYNGDNKKEELFNQLEK